MTNITIRLKIMIDLKFFISNNRFCPSYSSYLRATARRLFMNPPLFQPHCASPQYETARLDALRRLELLDSPPSEAFDRITRMAAQLFGLPIAAVSLTDSNRQWFKSKVGITHDT